MKENRIHQMQQYIKEEEFVSLEELCEKFGRSITTIRRDVNQLAHQGYITKIYGGVRWASQEDQKLISFQERTLKNAAAKESIGALAASYVEENDVIFIDSGTTTMHMIPHLAHLSHATIITNNLHVIVAGLSMPNLEIIVLGGTLNHETSALLLGNHMEPRIPFNIHKAFLAATGISLEQGVSHSASGEYDIKTQYLKQASQSFLLADQSKFNQTALITYAQLQDFQYLITDRTPPEDYHDALAKSKVELKIAESVLA